MAEPSLNAIRSFEAAGRHLSFSRAAQELNVTPGAVSRLVAELERTLGAPLFRRLHRRLELTETGAAYLPPVTDALERLRAATRQISARPRGDRLSLSMLPTFAMRWFMPRLPDFQRRHPGIAVEVTVADRLVDLSAEPIDMQIRMGRGPWPGLWAEKLLEETVILVAAPALLAEKPLRRPADLRRHSLMVHSTRPQAWRDWLAATAIKLNDKPKHGPSFEHFFMSIDAAINGLGLALVPDFMVREDLRHGRLAEPLPDHRQKRREGYWLVHRLGREREPAIRAFRDWVAEQARSNS